MNDYTNWGGCQIGREISIILVGKCAVEVLSSYDVIAAIEALE